MLKYLNNLSYEEALALPEPKNIWLDGSKVIVDTSPEMPRSIEKGYIATPEMFGIPLVSTNVDYTKELQELISQPRFAFPIGFKASTKTLYPKSNTIGFWGDAEISLLSGVDNFTPIISFEDVSNVHYIGGVFNGNRGRESGLGLKGQDGGLHGCRISSARDCYWKHPRFINAATDGIYINEDAPGSIYNFNFYSPVCDNNSRQGLSLIECSLVNFWDATFTNTNGKLPEAGIDVEPNLASENITACFYGVTKCSGNNGRGAMVYGSVEADNTTRYRLHFDNFIAKNNTYESLRLSGGGFKDFTINRMEVDGKISLGGDWKSSFRASSVICKEFAVETATGDNIFIDVNIDSLICGEGYSSTNPTQGSFRIGDLPKKIKIREVIAHNYGVDSLSSYSGFILGSGVTIDKYESISPRGLRIDGNNNMINVVTNVAMLNDTVRLSGYGNTVKIQKNINDGCNACSVYGNYNNIEVQWLEANASLVVLLGGNSNSIVVRSYNSTKPIVTFNSTSTKNLLMNSYFHRSNTGNLVSDSGVDNLVVGCYPINLNTVPI